MKIEGREKNILIYGGIVIALLLIYWALTPFIEEQVIIKETLSSKELMLEKTDRKIKEVALLDGKIKAASKKITQTEKRLLTGKTPSLAAAELQRILKGIAQSSDARVSSEKILDPIDLVEYRKIPVKITLNCTTKELKNFIYQVENNQVFLPISETTVKIINMKDPSKIEANLIVTGIIKQTEPIKPPVQKPQQKS